MANIFLNLPIPVGNGPGAAVLTSAMGKTKSVIVGGAFPGAVVSIEVSNDGGASFFPIAAFKGEGDETVIKVAAEFMRVNVAGRKNTLPFSANVDVGANDDGALFVLLPLPVLNGPGAPIAAAALGTFKTLVATGSWKGASVTVEFSDDGISWASLGQSFQSVGGLQSLDAPASFLRTNVQGRKSTVPFSAVVSVGAANDSGGSSFAGLNVQEEGVLVGTRPTMNFIGGSVTATDDIPNDRVNVTITTAAAIDPMLYTVFVAKNGNDGTADGSVENPFLTVQAAMEYAWTTYVLPLGPQPVAPFTRPCVFVNAGTYDDGALVLPPQICVMGEGFNHSRIKGDWSIDARWSNVPGADDFRSSWINVGLFGDVNIDFGPVFSNEGKLYATNVRFAGNVTITEKTVNPVSNQILFTAVEFLGNVTLNGIPTLLQGPVFRGGTLTLNQMVGTGVDNTFESSGGSIGNIVINSTSGAAPPYVCTFAHLAQPGATLTLNGTFSAINADLDAVPLQSLVTLVGGATLAQVFRINQLNWSGPTAERPTGPYVGQQFFDTTLVKPIWWDGAAWITWPTDSDSTVLTWGNANVGAAADTRFLSPGRDNSAVALVVDVTQIPAPRAGTLRRLYVRHNTAGGNGNSVVYTVLINGAATGITVTIPSGAVGQVADLVNTAAVVAGDRISLQLAKALGLAGGGVDAQASLEIGY